MAEETEAFLRYFQMRFRVEGRGRRAAQKIFANALRETLEHAEAIAQQIQLLGHVPTLHIDLALGGDRIGAEEALAEAIDIEQQALDAYTEFLPQVIGETALEAFIRKQIEIEQAHVEELRDELRARRSLALVKKPAE